MITESPRSPELPPRSGVLVEGYYPDSVGRLSFIRTVQAIPEDCNRLVYGGAHYNLVGRWGIGEPEPVKTTESSEPNEHQFLSNFFETMLIPVTILSENGNIYSELDSESPRYKSTINALQNKYPTMNPFLSEQFQK